VVWFDLQGLHLMRLRPASTRLSLCVTKLRSFLLHLTWVDVVRFDDEGARSLQLLFAHDGRLQRVDRVCVFAATDNALYCSWQIEVYHLQSRELSDLIAW